MKTKLHKKKAIIFDLDGTVIDTIGDIAAAVNRALEAFGYPKRTVAEIQSFLGNGSLMLIKRTLATDADDDFCREVRARFRAEYESDMYSLSRAYEGIAELLDKLNELGIASAVVTNKDDKCAVPMIKHYFGDRFACVRGVKNDTDRKPNPELTLSVLDSLGCSPEEALFVGDGMADLEVSENAGIDFIPVGYGYTAPSRLFERCGKEPAPDVATLESKILGYLL